MNSLKQAKIEGSVSIPPRQVVLKFLEKRWGQKIHKNWRPTVLLNVDTKIFSKALAAKVKPILTSIISSNQTALWEKVYQ